jgi:hypothetical protein
MNGTLLLLILTLAATTNLNAQKKHPSDLKQVMTNVAD